MRFPCILILFGQFFDSSMVSRVNVNRRDPWATSSFCLLLYVNFGVREDAVATVEGGAFEREIIEVKREALLAGFWCRNYPVGVTV